MRSKRRTPGPEQRLLRGLSRKNSISALLAGADPGAQQNNADAMIDFAKLPGIKNEQALIANAVAFRKHPRNPLDIGGGLVPSTPFCETALKNPELNGKSYRSKFLTFTTS